MSAENPEIKQLWQACDDSMDDQFVSSATENGVARREQMLNIFPFATDTLEDRRFRLMTRYGENTPYTRRSLMASLESLCGKNGFTLDITTATFTVDIRVALNVKKQENSVKELLERTIPYNMVIQVDLLYNSWSKVKTHTWGELSLLTWKDVKEEVLD